MFHFEGIDGPGRAIAEAGWNVFPQDVMDKDPAVAPMLYQLHSHLQTPLGQAPVIMDFSTRGQVAEHMRHCAAKLGESMTWDPPRWCTVCSVFLRHALRRGVCCSLKVHAGESGDVLRVPSLQPCEGLIAGPPCPPWSTLGDRGGDNDERSLVFKKILTYLEDGAAKGLKWFILENVPGIRNRKNKGPSYLTELYVWFASKLPQFTVVDWDMDPREYGLPQARGRVYIVGVLRDILNCSGSPMLKPDASPMPPLEYFLNADITTDELPKTAKQQECEVEGMSHV